MDAIEILDKAIAEQEAFINALDLKDPSSEFPKILHIYAQKQLMLAKLAVLGKI